MTAWPVEPIVLGCPLGLIPPLLLSVLLGGLVGLERELHAHPAGLRTHILVALGACIATIVSVGMASLVAGRGDPGRVAAQVVAGVGFLGAGAIIREGASVRGLTTAASIWATATVGIAVGATPGTAALGTVATLVCLAVLWWLHLVEDWMVRRGLRELVLEVHVSEAPEASANVLAAVVAAGASVESVVVEKGRQGSLCRMHLRVRLPAGPERSDLVARLAALEGVRNVSLE